MAAQTGYGSDSNPGDLDHLGSDGLWNPPVRASPGEFRNDALLAPFEYRASLQLPAQGPVSAHRTLVVVLVLQSLEFAMSSRMLISPRTSDS